MSIDKDFGSVVGRCEACGGANFSGHVCDDYCPAGFAQAAKAHLEAAELQRRKAEALDWLSIGSRICDMINYPKGTTVEYQYIGDGWVVYGGTLLECAEAAMRKEAGNG